MTPWGKKTTWNEIEYPSRRAAAKALGIHIDVLGYRLEQGYTSDADIVVQELRGAKSCVVNGTAYHSGQSAAKAVNMPYQQLMKLLRQTEKATGKREVTLS